MRATISTGGTGVAYFRFLDAVARDKAREDREWKSRSCSALVRDVKTWRRNQDVGPLISGIGTKLKVHRKPLSEDK